MVEWIILIWVEAFTLQLGFSITKYLLCNSAGSSCWPVNDGDSTAPVEQKECCTLSLTPTTAVN